MNKFIVTYTMFGSKFLNRMEVFATSEESAYTLAKEQLGPKDEINWITAADLSSFTLLSDTGL